MSDTLGRMSGESAVTRCVFTWCQAVQQTEFFVEDWGDGARWGRAIKGIFLRTGKIRWGDLTSNAARRNGAAPFPETRVFAPPSPFYNNG